MVYREDPDLEFLGQMKSEDLNDLVYCLTHDKDGEVRYTEELTNNELYKRFYPDHHQYWKEIAAEIPSDCFQQKFDKYEYLMKKGNLTKKEQDWIAEYKQTDEYEQIYGDESDKEVFNAQIICKNA